MYFCCRTILLIQLLHQLVVANDECDKEIVAAGNSLIQKQVAVHETVESVAAPWEKHILFIGSSHKAGTFLIRHIMTHWFDLLGATSSCTVGRRWPRGITTLNYLNDCDVYPAPIRWSWEPSGEMILQTRKDAHDMKVDVRGVIMVRDPLEMVASAYVYHQRGEEPWNPMEKGIPLLAPEEGVPEMAERMVDVITDMASAYEVRTPGILAVRYEDITNSSERFDAAIEKIMDSVFKDDISDLQKAEMLKAARIEDLHRQGDDEEHTNDEDDMKKARASLHLMSTNVSATYAKARKVLGYI